MATVRSAQELGLDQVQTNIDSTPLQTAQPAATIASAAQQNAQVLAVANESLTQVAGQFQAAKDKIQRRGDTIDRARKFTAFEADAQTILDAASDTSDLSLDKSLAGLNKNLDDLYARTLGEHAGSADSIAALTARLEESKAGFSSLGAQEGVRIQKQIVGEVLTERLALITAAALKEPGAITRYWQEWDKALLDMKDGMDIEEEFAQREAGRSAIVLSSIDTFTSQGNYLEAKTLID